MRPAGGPHLYTPIHTILSLHELFSDQLTTQPGCIGMMTLNNLIDLSFFIENTVLKLGRQPPENNRRDISLSAPFQLLRLFLFVVSSIQAKGKRCMKQPGAL